MKRLLLAASNGALLAVTLAAAAGCQTTGGKGGLFSGLNSGPNSRGSPAADVGNAVGSLGNSVGSLGTSVAKTWDSCKDLKPYDLTPENEYYLGRSATANVLNTYGLQNVLPAEHRLVAYVRRVGLAVAQTSGEHLGDAKLRAFEPKGVEAADRTWPVTGYHFFVVKADKPNAHGMPGGFVVVTTGMIDKTQNEEDLAAVLAHEIAHVHRGHGVTVVKRAMCAQVEGISGVVNGKMQEANSLLGSAISKAKANGLPFASQLNPEDLAKLFDGVMSVMQDATSKGYGKEFEFEADAVGSELMAWTGYGPKGMKDVLARLPPPAKGTFDLSSTHPDPKERLARVTALLAKEKLNELSGTEADRTPRFQEAKTSLRVQRGAMGRDTGSGGD